MRKNYSQKVLKPNISSQINMKNSSIINNKTENQSQRKTFTRKPAGGYLPLHKRRMQEPVEQKDAVNSQNTLTELLEKSKKVKFISSRSQASLQTSIISKSSTSLSLARSFNDKNDFEISCSNFLGDQSIIKQIDEQESSQRQLFKRKTNISGRLSVLGRRKQNDQSLNTSIMEPRYGKKIDKAQQQTKLQSSELSENSKSFIKPFKNIMNKNFLNTSKNSSKQSMRKSNSSNSLIKREATSCQQCEFHKKEIRQLTGQNQRLQRILKNKQEQIAQINKRLKQSQNRNRQLEKKIKQVQKFDYQNKLKILQEQFNIFQEQSNRTKDTLAKTLQELKYKNIENCTLKKYQAQCQSLERKVQMLVAERNQLRQRLSSVKTSQKSSYVSYPSSFAKNSKLSNSCRLPQGENKRDSLTSRKQSEVQQDSFGEDYHLYQSQNLKTHNDGFTKKKTYAKCFDDNSESEIISLSEESSF